jgi:hypothetical protein
MRDAEIWRLEIRHLVIRDFEIRDCRFKVLSLSA